MTVYSTDGVLGPSYATPREKRADQVYEEADSSIERHSS